MNLLGAVYGQKMSGTFVKLQDQYGKAGQEALTYAHSG